MELSRNVLSQLGRPEITDETIEWEEAALILEKDEEQYIEGQAEEGVGVLHYREDASDAALLSLIRPWIESARKECEGFDPLRKVVEFTSSLTGPENIVFHRNVGSTPRRFELQYGGDVKLTIFDGGTVGQTWRHSTHQITGGKLVPNWRERIVEWIEENKGEQFSDTDRRQLQAIEDAISRTEEFEPVFATMHNAREITGVVLDGEKIDLRFESLDGPLGVCHGGNNYIKLDLEGARQSISMSEPDFDSNDQRIRLRTMEVTLHELGHAVNHHDGPFSGFGGGGYCWQHELEAEAFVAKHAQSKLEAEAFEVWAMANLRSKHYD